MDEANYDLEDADVQEAEYIDKLVRSDEWREMVKLTTTPRSDTMIPKLIQESMLPLISKNKSSSGKWSSSIADLDKYIRPFKNQSIESIRATGETFKDKKFPANIRSIVADVRSKRVSRLCKYLHIATSTDLNAISRLIQWRSCQVLPAVILHSRIS